MEETKVLSRENTTKQILYPINPAKLLLSVVVTAVVLGTLTGYIIAQKGNLLQTPGTRGITTGSAKSATQDTRTFKDFAQGVIKAKPQPKNGDYPEGTHTLIRDGAVPVALTSSVVDLSKYEGKKVKVYGETQKALTEGWLMDVGRVDEIK